MKILKSSRMILSFVVLSLIALTALFIRTVDLNSLPIFVDEAIYVRWAQVMRAEPTLRFLPLSDGKQPLFMWLIIPFLKLFSDPLIAGRLVSVFSGLGTIYGIFILSILLFNSKKVGLVASLMYALSPYGVFFDRLALVDSHLTMWAVWTLNFALITVKTRRLDSAMLAGFTLGAALITKSPGLFFFLLIPITFIYFKKDTKYPKVSFLYAAILILIIWMISFFVFNILRLGPNFHLIFSRNLDYVHPVSRLFTNPTDPFISNFKEYLSWLVYFGPYPILFMIVIAFTNFRKNYKALFLLSAWAIGPVLIQSEFSIAFTARYVLFTIPFLFVIAASSILSSNKFGFLPQTILVWFVILSFYRNFVLITNPISAKMPNGERSGYIEEWTAGFGIKESAQIIKKIRDDDPNAQILVATEGYFGTLPDGIQIYLEKEANITVIGVGLDIKEVPAQIINHKKAGGRSFLVANSSRLKFTNSFEENGLKLLYSYQKPDRQPGTHGYVAFGESDTFYLFELVDISDSFDIVLPQ